MLITTESYLFKGKSCDTEKYSDQKFTVHDLTIGNEFFSNQAIIANRHIKYIPEPELKYISIV